MTTFWIGAAALTAAALAFLLVPLWRERRVSGRWSYAALLGVVAIVPLAFALYATVRTWQPELIERYVDPGELRIEWREFPYLGEPADTLSVGALAAGEQDAFWEYQEAVFDKQDDLKSAAHPEEELMGVADDLGLDTERFATDLESEELAQRVEDDFSQGLQIGVSGTPAFIINGDPVMGAQPLDVFVNSIDLALVAAES